MNVARSLTTGASIVRRSPNWAVCPRADCTTWVSIAVRSAMLPAQRSLA